MIVAYFTPHNEGVEAGIITGPDFDSELTLVDLYEVDETVKSFETEDDAVAWLKAKHKDLGVDDPKLKAVTGGKISTYEYN